MPTDKQTNCSNQLQINTSQTEATAPECEQPGTETALAATGEFPHVGTAAVESQSADDAVDEASEESFPASDPSSHSPIVHT